MKPNLLALMAFLVSSPLSASEPWYPIAPFTEPKIYKGGDWELRIYYLRKGSKSEGMNGDLLYKGRRLKPAFPSSYVQTPFGDLTFFPAPKEIERNHYRPNIVIGWTFRDYTQVPWTIPEPPAWHARTDWKKADPEFED